MVNRLSREVRIESVGAEFREGLACPRSFAVLLRCDHGCANLVLPAFIQDQEVGQKGMMSTKTTVHDINCSSE
jgi:hypothetical protein